jgi:hypothetical protein
MSFLVKVQKTADGKEGLTNAVNIGGSNVVLTNVPCESSVYVGAVVVMKSNGEAKNALADSQANANVLGVCESKASATLCNIRVLGKSEDIFVGLDVTKEYFLSPTVPGGIQTTIPTNTGEVAVKIGQPFSATSMVVLKGQMLVRE